MMWYNILNPKNWPGVNIKTGNKKIDGVYYNMLSSNHVSLAASGSMYLVGNSGIKLISSSYVDTSGLRAAKILAENYGRIDVTGGIIPLYSGSNNGILVKLDNDSVYATDIIQYSSNELRFPSASPGAVLYTVPSYTLNGTGIPTTKKISSYEGMSLSPSSTDQEGNVTEPASVTVTSRLLANSGISIGPNNFLDSYKGFILTHDGSGNIAQWKPATYLRENYDDDIAMDGLERTGASWIRYPRRPALIKDGKLYIYKTNRSWSPYDAIGDNLDNIKNELGTGSDTICVTKIFGELIVGYTKFAFIDKALSEQTINTSFNFDDRILEGSIADPNRLDPTEEPAPCWIIEIAPENPGGIPDTANGTNVLIFSVTKGGYFPMQIEPLATEVISLRDGESALTGTILNKDDGTLLEDPVSVNLSFKPSTLNNISIRPNIHTAFNMLGEDIDFLIYGKQFTPFNTYSNIFDLTENLIPTGTVPVFKIDATIPNSVSGSPTGVIYSKFIDRQKIKPIGWNYDNSGKVCIKTHDAYELGSIPSGTGTFLKSYADVTISGHTYTTSLITQDIFLKPIPAQDNTGKYIRNALLTVNGAGQIVSRTPKINPTTPGAPSGINIDIFGNQACSISWVPPVENGNSDIVNYVVQASINNGISWITLPLSNSIDLIRGFNTQYSATISPMDGINNSIFRVAAQNKVGIGDYSDPTTTNYSTNPNSPKMPINFNFNRNIENEILSDITLEWTWNDQSFTWGSGSSPSGFLLEESSFDGISYSSFSGIAFINYSQSVISYSHNETGLSGKDHYLYRLSAINTNNISSSYNYVYSTGLLSIDLDIEEEQNKNTEELTNFDFGTIMFTGTCLL